MRSLLIFMACFAVVAALSRPPTKHSDDGSEPHQRPLLARKEMLQILGAPYKHLLADYYWIQATHATGEAKTQEEYRDLYYYVDMVTDLDPDFRYAYVFGGVIIPYNYGREHWTNTEESTALLRKGLKRFPNDVYLRTLLAYNLSFFHKQYRPAAKLLEETSKLPGAPKYLVPLATRLYAQSGDIDAGLELANSLAASSADPDTRKAFETRVKELELERALQEVEAAVKQFKAREGHLPEGLHELVVSGDLKSIPDDPLGGSIYLDPDGEVASTSREHRLRTYDPLKDRPMEREH